ncbi:MAG: putative glycoside hydrolase, partial [Lachnospiraceae bacterium]|nr:putative glycoside hydrolase [Lachnospiraceae bacterium]
VFRDKNGEAWINPYKQEVWDYLVEIGAQAAKDGFDEIQFDYIRFSTDANADSIDYGEEAELMTKEEAITGFARYAYDKLHPLGVMVSADVFGTIIDNESDAEIVGQNYQEMAACLDYICPMVYPSHYSNGVYGLDIPDKEPYDTVYQAMNESRKKLETLTLDEEPDEVARTAGVRVWIQDFTATWLKGHISYGPPEVRAQIQAIYDAGYEEWILWNARMNYTEEALLPNWQEAETVY